MKKIKVLYINLLGVSILAITLTSGVLAALDDLEFEGSNNRRILQNTDESRAENRTKRLRQASVEKTTTAAPDDDDDKKTLAQQVADGKYGLIQKELFASPAKRPGIISYEVNPEVPKDNVNNLGGLQAEEIWLAENHLLVLKGGLYGETDNNGKAVWPPIDNYIAPQRQVKIPSNPRVPPPFPIQLKDGGPIEFVKGANGTGGPVLPFFDPRFGPPNFFPLPPFPGQPPKDNQNGTANQGNFTEGNGFGPPFPFPPPPGSGLFPPAVAFLPPPGNLTELDEDDPSIYYPPPYDFIYHKDNSSFVPPGPLVPGIVLPPPPDFFAPYDNKTKSASMKQLRKPSKAKLRPPQYVQEQRKTTRPTRPPTVTVSIVTPTTTRPIIKSSTDSSQNEIIPPRTNVLPSDTPIGEWVPIPAPRPFYISELKNLRVGNKMRHYSPAQWNMQNNTHVIHSDNYDVRGYDYSPPQKKARKYSTTVAPLRGFKPIYVPPSVTTTTLKPIAYTTTFNPIKPPENYYYFRDSPLNNNYNNYNNNPYTKRPLNSYYDYGDKNVDDTNTVAPVELYNDVSVKSPADIGNIEQSHYDFYRQQFEPTTTSSPINFYYFDKNNPNPQSLIHDVNVQKEIKSHRTNSKHLIPPMRSTTEKPPIFEYSYSAPGYGTVESPKVGNNFATTPKSVSFDINFPIENDQYTYSDYQSPQKSNYYRHESTPAPSQYYSTNRPSYEEVDGYGREVYKAKPTYAPRAKEQNLQLEDVTQKYFSIFGQKLNEQDLREMTSPAPSSPEKHYYNYGKQSRPKVPNKHVKFPNDDYYDAPSEQPYYTLPQKPVYGPPAPSRHNHYQQQVQYPNYYRFSSPQYDPYATYDEEQVVSPGHSLHSDINVNLKQPPPLEPEAELIDPAFVRPRGNAFISYQLPGSGGHFYFLTPQTVKSHFQPQAYPEFSGYYKRNVQSNSRRPRNPRKP